MSFQTPVRCVRGRPSDGDASIDIPSSPFIKRAGSLGPGCSPSVDIPPSPFMKRLGYGTGVCVYLLPKKSATTPIRNSPWAVKKINRRIKNSNLPEYEKRLKKEAVILKSLNHPNIVGYKGVSRGGDGTLCLCMESGEKSLFDMIEERQQTGEGPFLPAQIFKVAKSVAEALLYLHSEHKLLHGDIKSGNVLVEGDFQQVKLCDFGVAVQLNDSLQGLKNPKDMYIGSGPWTSKEALDGEAADVTDKCDIYSYGCLLYEMLTLKIPHSEMFDESMQDESFDEEVYQQMLGTRPALLDIDYDATYMSLIELFCCCTCERPESRPPASLIVNVLNTIESSQLIRGSSSSPVLID